jgi:hypothetical protein
MALTPFEDGPDVVQSAFQDRMREAKTQPEALIGHAFVLELEHRPVLLEEVFEATALFDYHEVSPDCRLIVDVLEVASTHSRLHVKPDRPLSYRFIAEEVGALVGRASRRIFGGTLRVTRVRWQHDVMGAPSRPQVARNEEAWPSVQT